MAPSDKPSLVGLGPEPGLEPGLEPVLELELVPELVPELVQVPVLELVRHIRQPTGRPTRYQR